MGRGLGMGRGAIQLGLAELILMKGGQSYLSNLLLFIKQAF